MNSLRADFIKTRLFAYAPKSWCVFGAVFFLSACAHVGPGTIPMDRFDYSTAVADSWKQQTLLNIIKLRYMDLPVFVDVASIVSGYSIETSGNFGGQSTSGDVLSSNALILGGASKFTDRPTITYVPLTGEKFLRGLITPIDPKNIFFMLQTGYAADFILGLTVESLNGVRNRSSMGGGFREADADFAQALDLMREVQHEGAFGMRVEESTATGSVGVLFFRRDDLPSDTLEKMNAIRRLLRLPSDQQSFEITYSPMRGTDSQLAVNSRSMLQIMQAFASYLDVPEAHLQDHSAVPAFEHNDADNLRNRIKIHSGKEKPESAFARVFYRDYWFWIDERDLATKRALTAVMFFFTLADTGGKDPLPLITIPAQ